MFKQARHWLRGLRQKTPLTRADLRTGLRVRFREDVDLWPICVLRKGQTGTITYVSSLISDDPQQVIAAVTMHEYCSELKDWDNAVHIHADGSEGGPLMPSDLEAL